MTSVAPVRHLERQVNVEPEEPEEPEPVARTGFLCPNGANVLVLLDVAAFVDHGSVQKSSSGLPHLRRRRFVKNAVDKRTQLDFNKLLFPGITAKQEQSCVQVPTQISKNIGSSTQNKQRGPPLAC